MAYYPYQSQYYTQLAQAYAPAQAPQQGAAPAQQAGQGGIIWIQGEQAAKSYMVAPNTTVLLMDSESQQFYLKSADASGMPLPLRVFEYSERTKNVANTSSAASGVDLSIYTTKAEFDSFKDEIRAMVKNAAKQPVKETEGEVYA